jgi:triosephosphate isomerase
MIPKLVIANWKMAIDRASVGQFRDEWESGHIPSDVTALIAPPVAFLSDIEGIAGAALCAQDVSAHEAGAHTGEISAQMLREFGCSYALVGHSERRHAWNESNALVAEKACRLEAVGICPVICVGESKEVRRNGNAESVVAEQVLASIEGLVAAPVIAYEPIWAIGSGEAATSEIAEEMHRAIKAAVRERFDEPVAVLYGGSVKATNARDFTACESVDGLLVGGASLSASSFISICQSVGGIA